MPVTTVISNMGSTEYVKPVKVRTLSTSWEINHCIYIYKKKKINLQAVIYGYQQVLAVPHCKRALRKECQEHFSRLKDSSEA